MEKIADRICIVEESKGQLEINKEEAKSGSQSLLQAGDQQ